MLGKEAPGIQQADKGEKRLVFSAYQPLLAFSVLDRQLKRGKNTLVACIHGHHLRLQRPGRQGLYGELSPPRRALNPRVPHLHDSPQSEEISQSSELTMNMN